MPLSCRLLPLTAVAIALAAVAGPAAAQQGPRTAPPADPTHSQQSDTLSDAVRRIERSNRGQVLSAERMQYDGRDVTRIKVVDDQGRVRIYMDDAPSKPEQGRPPPKNDATPSRRRNDD